MLGNKTLQAILLGIATLTQPTYSQLSETSQLTLQQEQAVLPLPFASKGYADPWFLGEGSDVQQGNSIQVLDSRASRLVEDQSSIEVLVEAEDGYAFAHEAPVYFGDKDELYFCSDAGGKQGRSNSTTNNVVFRVALNATIARARQGSTSLQDAHVEPLDIGSDSVQMTNGGTAYQNQLLLVNSGRTAAFPPSLVVIDRSKPSRVKTLLNNVAGKQFNGLNDVKVNFHTGSIYFTDTSYGQSQNFRPQVALPKATWRFDPITLRLTMLDASIITPNGLALSKDGQTLYVTETASNPGGDLAQEPGVPSVM